MSQTAGLHGGPAVPRTVDAYRAARVGRAEGRHALDEEALLNPIFHALTRGGWRSRQHEMSPGAVSRGDAGPSRRGGGPVAAGAPRRGEPGAARRSPVRDSGVGGGPARLPGIRGADGAGTGGCEPRAALGEPPPGRRAAVGPVGLPARARTPA
ncbi:MAG TPA: hypothetical protein VM367_08135, partial [Pseudonocardia sp.]|nr:hypothetical protein [Pseudonocardia sp.]